MSEEKQSPPKVFISYSWAVQDRVKILAAQLIQDGIDVIADFYDLKSGNDIYAFMERQITDPTIDHVLIICDETYAKKANDRIGGVGNETVIITPEIYGKVNQKKFIPIVFEKNEQGHPFCPIYLQSRIYIDLSDSEHYEAEYNKLLHDLYGIPLCSKPELGEKPQWVNGRKTVSGTSSAVSELDSSITQEQNAIEKLSLQILKTEFSSQKSSLLISQQYNIILNINSFLSFIQRTELLMGYIDRMSSTKRNIIEVIPDVIQARSLSVFDIGTTENEIVFNTYSLLKLLLNSIILQDIIKRPSELAFFKEKVLRPFVACIENYLDDKTIEKGICESRTSKSSVSSTNQNTIIVNGGQVNISLDNSTINAVQNTPLEKQK